MDTDNDTILEPGKTPDENGSGSGPFWILPPQSEILAATPDQRAILYAETLARIAAAGETVNLLQIQAACGLTSDLFAKNAPRLLAEDPVFAHSVRDGHKKLPKSGAGWHSFWRGMARKTKSPIGGEHEQTSPTGDAAVKVEASLEKVSDSETSPIGDAERRARFETLKQIVHAKLDGFLEAGAALAEIRAEKFYRFAGFERFEDFVREEFHLSKPYAYRLMDAVASIEDLSTLPPGVPAPTKAEQVRPLTGLTPEEKKEVWTEAAAASARAGRAPSGATVRKVREARSTAKANANKPSGSSKSATTAAVPGRSASAVSLKTDVVRAADALEKVLAGWKLTDLAPLKERARDNLALAGGLERLERNLDGTVKTLRGYRTLAS